MPQQSRSAETSKPSETGSLHAAGSPAASPVATGSSSPAASTSPSKETAASREVATFGAGCFWCVEAVLQQLDGVLDVKSGYMGGDVPNPTYEQVCTGTTGHAEVAQITFDPAKITYTDLLGWYFKLHDPTTLNRQGNDVGTQYRSVIFYHSDAQKAAAQGVKAKLAASGAFRSTIVTEISPAGPFYEAEKYHQDFYRQNRAQPYCRYVITPKLEKLGLEK